ncbi:MAG: ferrous iron transport protein B [Candidatus Fermentibacter sp.]|nr:ferrous iron transport protein B [Candidatus Fermentibacter sp.]
MNEIRVLLAGNPNTGKSTIFNRLTGASAHEGNYPGVTVELACGSRACGESLFRFVDLPGQYSLAPASEDEAVAVRYILDNPGDIILDVLDARNLERNLLLTIQLARLGTRLVVALNMCDEASAEGRMPDMGILSDRLGVPVVATVGRTGEGIDALLEAIAGAAAGTVHARPLRLGGDAEEQIAEVASLLPDGRLSPSGLASMLVEGNPEAVAMIRRTMPGAAGAVIDRSTRAAARLEALYGDPAPLVLAALRRGLAAGLVREAVGVPGRRFTEPAATRRIDSIVLNRYLGFPVLALLMFLTFWLTFQASAPLEGLIGSLFGLLSEGIGRALPEGALRSLVTDGIIGGVGGVLLYVPGISVLFLAISLMEDTGYMARAAFLTDGLMHRFGLNGRSIIPMLLGFGCTVPAVLATRTIESRRDRLATILVLPLFSCGARLPVFLLVAGAFFPGRQAAVLILTYGLGILLALLAARFLTRSVIRGGDSPFVMELPPYRLPTARALTRHVWARVSHYLAKAGTVILAFSAALWLMGYFPRPQAGADPAEALEASFSGRLGHALEPLVEPLGFDWRIATALTGSIGARELFISQMAILASLGGGGDAGLAHEMSSRYSPGTGAALVVFMLISAPCLSAVAVTARETRSWKMALGQYAALTALAWLAAFAVKTLLG